MTAAKRFRLTEAQYDQIAELRERGLSYEQIARRVGRSSSTVSWHCLRLGAEPPIPPRPRPEIAGPLVMQRGDHLVRRFTPDEDARLLALAAEGANPSVIGRALDRAPNTIRGRLMTLARRDARQEFFAA